ncbi:MAG TPA: protoporphyrinogen oxidase [Phototrophicaceae bacterium]|nr:protoporphyrinogen oxidase [Phototrophicaceae bacterium]
MTNLAIIGGGITGLSAAWFAQQAGLSYTLLEASARLGGKVTTERVGDFVIEGGPDSFLTQKPAALQLARDLGLSEQLIPINSRPHATYVLHHGQPIPLPEGVALIVPTKFAPFLRSPLLSPLGKLRMALDWVLPARRDDADETLADFVRRRLGSEAVDKLAAPLMAGIYNAEAEEQSLLATFPRYRDLERKYGSIIRGTREQRKAQKPSGQPAFMTLRDGTQILIDALVDNLRGDVRLNTKVQSIEPIGTRSSLNGSDAALYTLTLGSGERIDADAVLITAPAYVAADLIRVLAPKAATVLGSLRYLSSGTISLVYHADQIQHPIDGFGVIIPPSERRSINAITISSDKFAGRAPGDHVLLRVFFGGSRSPQMMALGDDDLIIRVRAELSGILGIDAPPLLSRIYRWQNANPQYDLGHLQRIDTLEASLPPGLRVAGSAYRGVGLPDCIQQAQTQVQRLIQPMQRVNHV